MFKVRKAPKVVDAMVNCASSKAVGNVKIFVYPIEKAIDISTGEAHDHSLQKIAKKS